MLTAQFPADFVTFTEETLNWKLHFLYRGRQDSLEMTVKKQLVVAFLKNTVLYIQKHTHL